MFKLVAARVVFAIGLVAVVIAVGQGTIPQSMGLYAILGHVLFCELVLARFIKARITPPLSTSQENWALLPWFFPFAGMAAAVLIPILDK